MSAMCFLEGSLVLLILHVVTAVWREFSSANTIGQERPVYIHDYWSHFALPII